MRFGLIGYGAWGRHHAEAIGKADDAELIAIACKTEKTSELAKQEHPGVSVYRDYRDLLKRSDIDAVDIVIPTYLHSEVGIAALEASKHVLLEKPIAGSIEECGDPISIFSFGNSKNRTRGLYDNFSTIVRFPNDAYAVITQTLGGFEHHQVVEIVGMKGSIRGWWSGAMDRTLKPEFGLKIQRAGRDQCEEISMPSPSGEVFELEEELRQTVEGFKTGRALLPPEEARKSVVICLEAERSLKERREIQLKW